jgi:hypothetical protein
MKLIGLQIRFGLKEFVEILWEATRSSVDGFLVSEMVLFYEETVRSLLSFWFLLD